MKLRITDSVEGGGLTKQSGHFWWSRMISTFFCGILVAFFRDESYRKLLVNLRKTNAGNILFFSFFPRKNV
jgi:hypothetical protein